MTQLKVKDNTYTEKGKFIDIKLLSEKIKDKTLEQLSKEGIFIFPEIIKDSEDMSKDQMILKSSNDCYVTSNVMGFIGYKKERLVIESRFSDGEKDYFLQYLLECVLDYPNVLELNTDINRETKTFDLLTFIFPYYLKSAMRKGLYKTYILNKYNNNNVKGVIDIARHISSNTPFIGKISYNQREFSYDNYLMQLIRHTIEFIKTKSYGNNLLYKVKEEASAVIEVTKSYEYHDKMKIIIENKKDPIRHAYYQEYRTLQQLCIKVLQYGKHQMGSGSNQIHGVLFDGAWIWEEYINYLISDKYYHPMNKGGKGVQWLFDRNRGQIYPDFISRNNEKRIIADAKYKPSKNIYGKDYLQILAYMFRFDAKKAFYLYPEVSNSENIELKMNSGSKYEDNVSARDDIMVIKCALHVPQDCRNYEEFKRIMYCREEEFKNQII